MDDPLTEFTFEEEEHQALRTILASPNRYMTYASRHKSFNARRDTGIRDVNVNRPDAARLQTNPVIRLFRPRGDFIGSRFVCRPI
jgi:hypothetical protein